MNELILVNEIKEILDSQYNYFINTFSNPKELMQTIGDLDSKYNKPYIVHLTRQVDRTYDSDETELTKLIQKSLTKYIQSETNDKYNIKFKNIRNLTFSIFKDEDELSRFSLMDRNYALMNSLLREEDYHKDVLRTEERIQQCEKELSDELDKVVKYEKYIDNYWLLFKDIKSVSDLFNVLFKRKKLVKGLNNLKLKAQTMVNHFNEEIKRNRDNFEYLESKKEKSIKVINDIELFFSKVGYECVDKRHFYF